MARFLNLIAAEPDIARVPVMIDSLEVVGDRGGPEVRAGQGRSSTRSASRRARRRSSSRRARCAATAPPWSSWPSTSRARPTRVERKVAICERAYRLLTEQVGFPPEDIIFDPEHLRRRHRHRGAQRLRASTSSRRRAQIKRALPARAGERRRQQRVVLVPRQRPGARGDALGVPLPRDPRRHGHGHRQRRPARGLRGDPAGAARARRGRDPQPPRRTPPSGCSRSPRASRASGGAQRRPRISPGAAGRSRSASSTRWSRASTSSSSRTPRRRACKAERPLAGDRRPADGRHERGRRPVRRRQDVPAAGGQERARDEEGGRVPDAVHRGGARTAGAQRANGTHRDGHRQGRRARHRQEHRRRRAPVQQLRGHRPRRHGAVREDPRDRAARAAPT